MNEKKERMTSITFNLPVETKQIAEKAFKEMGLTMTAGLNMFIRVVAREGRIPFEIISDETAWKKQVSKKLAESDRETADLKIKKYSHQEFWDEIKQNNV